MFHCVKYVFFEPLFSFVFLFLCGLESFGKGSFPDRWRLPVLGKKPPKALGRDVISDLNDKCVVTFECRNPLLCIMKRQRRNDILVEQVVERLKSIRRDRGLTQENVRFDTDLNIGRIESGRHSISLTTLADLCDYYGISLEEFFKEIETQRQPSRQEEEVV